MFDTNVLFDYFLGRDPDVVLLVSLSGTKLEIRVPEFVLLEFRGSVLRELGKLQRRLQETQALANDLDRADELKGGASKLFTGIVDATRDVDRLKQKVDPFLVTVRGQVTVMPHSPDLHYRGDLRFVQGLPPDEPKRGVQDCRIFEAALDIARADAAVARTNRYFLTKDSDFLRKPGVAQELATLNVELIDRAAPIYWQFK